MATVEASKPGEAVPAIEAAPVNGEAPVEKLEIVKITVRKRANP